MYLPACFLFITSVSLAMVKAGKSLHSHVSGEEKCVNIIELLISEEYGTGIKTAVQSQFSSFECISKQLSCFEQHPVLSRGCSAPSQGQAAGILLWRYTVCCHIHYT